MAMLLMADVLDVGSVPNIATVLVECPSLVTVILGLFLHYILIVGIAVTKDHIMSPTDNHPVIFHLSINPIEGAPRHDIALFVTTMNILKGE